MTLRIYAVSLEMVKDARGFLLALERRDADLSRQLRRAATSVSLHISEGMYSRGKSRAVRYHSAMGSAREVLAGYEVAEAMGYIESIDVRITERLLQIIGTLHRLVRP